MKQAIILTENEISALVKDAIKQVLMEINDSRQTIEHLPPIITGSQLQKMTGWSTRTLQHMRDTKQIPFIQHGRKILYPTHDLIKTLEKYKIEAEV